jgi:hypothetical protein
MKIEIEVSDREATQLIGATEHELRWLLMDALAEYKAHRAEGDAEAYVEKRYAEMDGTWRLMKIEKVKRMFKLASAIKNGIVSIAITEG